MIGNDDVAGLGGQRGRWSQITVQGNHMTSYFTLIDERQPSARSRHRMKRMKGFERPLMTDTLQRVIFVVVGLGCPCSFTCLLHLCCTLV